MNLLSDRINKLATSATLAMAAKTRELKASGRDIIGLSLGEPDFNVPDFIKEAAIEGIHQNYSSYSPVNGYQDLREAISLKFKRDNHLEYKPNQIVVSTGAKQSLANITLVMLNPGDEVVLPAPYWVSYSDLVKIADGEPIEVPTSIESDFKITPQQLETAITDKTKLIIFSSPCNPTGSVYSLEELEGLAEVVLRHPNLFVVSDEIYEHINFTGTHASIATIPGMYERTITVNGVSKAFAMTGWRIGYIGAPQWIADACNKIQGQITSGANSIAQRATIAAVLAPVSSVKYMVDAFKVRRDLVLRLLSEIPGIKTNVPEGAFYVFPDVSFFFGKTIRGKKIENSDDFSMYLLEEANVATVTGDAFGSKDCIRISYAASTEELTEALKRIKSALS